MTEVLGRKLTRAVLNLELDGTSKKRYAAMVARRVNGEPIPRIKGHYTFRGLDMVIRDGVFVPRASSELLAVEAIRALRRRRGQRVAVDVATGAGPVALAVANEVRNADVWGVDISAAATEARQGECATPRARQCAFSCGRPSGCAPAPAARCDRCLHDSPPLCPARGPEATAQGDPRVRAAAVPHGRIRRRSRIGSQTRDRGARLAQTGRCPPRRGRHVPVAQDSGDAAGCAARRRQLDEGRPRSHSSDIRAHAGDPATEQVIVSRPAMPDRAPPLLSCAPPVVSCRPARWAAADPSELR